MNESALMALKTPYKTSHCRRILPIFFRTATPLLLQFVGVHGGRWHVKHDAFCLCTKKLEIQTYAQN